MKPIRISIVTETYVPDVNGVANSLRQLIQAMSPQRYRIQIIRTRPRSEWIPEVEEVWVAGLTIPVYPDLQIGLPARRRIAAVWNQFQPDLVFIATEGPLGSSALKEAAARNIPTLSAFHTNFHRYSSYYGLGWIKSLTLFWLRRFHNRTLTTLVPSAESADFLRQAHFRNVHVLPHGVDCRLFNPERRSSSLREQWQVTDSQPVMLYVGRIAVEKNIPQVIETYQQCREKYPQLKLVMVGDGPMRLELEEKYKEIIFCGVQTGEALARHYASADLFIFASQTETFGLVTLEAMASGLPVVAYDMAAAGQFIRDGIDGELAEPNTSSDFSAAAFRLLTADLCKRGREARKNAEAASWDSVARIFEQHIAAALNTENSLLNKPCETLV